MQREKIGQMKDEEIIEMILKSSEPKYFEILYDRYAERIYNKCLDFFSDRFIAEDATHDILFKVYLKLSTFSNKSKFSTWVFAITYNFCVDHLKKQTKMVAELTKYIDEEGNDVDDDDLMNSEQDLMTLQADRIKLLMHQIPNEERIILLLKYQDDMSVKDICRVTELSESAVKMRLKRGREKLLRIYKEKYAHNVI